MSCRNLADASCLIAHVSGYTVDDYLSAGSSLPLTAAGFSIEPEITARLLQHGERIFEVPVHYRARASEEGKKLTAADGFRVIGTLLRCRFGANPAG